VSGPTPDPNMQNREIEHKLNQIDRFLKKRYKDDYSPDPYDHSTYSRGRESDAVVPARKIEKTFGSNPSSLIHEPPLPARRTHSSAPIEEFSEPRETEKPNLGAPAPTPGMDDLKSTDQKENGSTVTIEEIPLSLRLENRLTSRAIAPRDRVNIVTNQMKTGIVKSVKKPANGLSGTPRPAELASH
jgi:hypothetical protein